MVREGSGLGSKNYCKACAGPILDLAKQKFISIIAALNY
jgi:hypothetical protein